MRPRILFPALALFASIEAHAAAPQVEQFTRELPIDATGTVWLNNPYGSIDVAGTEDDKLTITIQRQITATDDQALMDARRAVVITFEGDSRVQVIKTRFPEPSDQPREA